MSRTIFFIHHSLYIAQHHLRAQWRLVSSYSVFYHEPSMVDMTGDCMTAFFLFFFFSFLLTPPTKKHVVWAGLCDCCSRYILVIIAQVAGDCGDFIVR